MVEAPSYYSKLLILETKVKRLLIITFKKGNIFYLSLFTKYFFKLATAVLKKCRNGGSAESK